MRNFFRLPKKPAGETLLETIVAITVLSMILVSVFSLLTQALSANQDIKNRVIALSHAREGIEGVRNIRDTNWLRFSGDRRNKWLCLDTPDCTQKIESKKYVLDYAAGEYDLNDTGNDFDLTNTTYEVETGSIFHRKLEFVVTDNVDICSGGGCKENKLHVVSQVKWKEGEATRTVTLEAYLYDFYGRNSY